MCLFDCRHRAHQGLTGVCFISESICCPGVVGVTATHTFTLMIYLQAEWMYVSHKHSAGIC